MERAQMRVIHFENTNVISTSLLSDGLVNGTVYTFVGLSDSTPGNAGLQDDTGYIWNFNSHAGRPEGWYDASNNPPQFNYNLYGETYTSVDTALAKDQVGDPVTSPAWSQPHVWNAQEHRFETLS